MPSTTWSGLEGPGGIDVFFRGDPVEVTTRVLEACRNVRGGEVDEGAEGLTLSGRIGSLAAVLLRSQASPALAVPLRCPTAACGELFEGELPLAALDDLGRRAEAEPVVEVRLDDGRTVHVRRPTAADLRRWRAAGWSDAGEAARSVAAGLLILEEGEEPPDLETTTPVLAERMEEADPLAAFLLITRCPACRVTVERELDLEGALLDRLEALQRSSLRDVHRLASRYGWSEAEVLRLPAWRRSAYLALIDAEDGP